VQKRIVFETLVEAEALVQERSLIERYTGPQLTNIHGNAKKLARSKKQEERANPDQMLSANEAGKLLGVSGKTVIRMMEDGEFPGYRIGIAWKFRRGILRRIGTLVGIDQSMRKRISKAKHNGCDNEDKIFSQSGSLEFTL